MGIDQEALNQLNQRGLLTLGESKTTDVYLDFSASLILVPPMFRDSDTEWSICFPYIEKRRLAVNVMRPVDGINTAVTGRVSKGCHVVSR